MMHALAQELYAAGLPLAGVVQQNLTPEGTAPDCACEMMLIFPSEPDAAPVRISQNLGRGSKGCRLDAGALEQAVARVEAQLTHQNPALLILNRFGKQEALGRGFCPPLAQALAQGVPVLIAVPDDYRQNFDTYCDGMATQMTPEAARDWALSLIPAAEVDARDLLCPLPVLKLQKAMAAAAPGAAVRLLATDPAARIDVPHFAQQTGARVLAVSGRGDATAYLLRKAQSAP